MPAVPATGETIVVLPGQGSPQTSKILDVTKRDLRTAFSSRRAPQLAATATSVSSSRYIASR